MGRPEVVFEDDGIGLAEAEIHEFLATIDQTSKRDDFAAKRGDFIGQFGIGLLSCFLVSDEIVIHTRSARGGGKTLEWRGRADGTYTLTAPEGESPVGTRVRLLSKPGFEERLRQAGQGLRSLHQARMNWAVLRGNAKEVARHYVEWQAAARDGVSDCPACELHDHVE